MSKGFVNRATYLEPPPLGVEELKQTIKIESILIHYGRAYKNGKWQCPIHRPDNDPSAVVNDRGYVHCFACNKSWDIISIVMELEKLSFREALYWLNDQIANLPKQIERKIALAKQTEYKGAVPANLLRHWVGLMTDTRKERLEQSRGISSRTAEQLKLGWDVERQAWAIPYWRGLPGKSDADILQFRKFDSNGWRYRGLTGYNRPSVLNRHVIKDTVVLLFGTFDAIRALQDNIPAVSTNGSSVFDSTKSIDAQRLAEMFNGVKNGYVVPDQTPSEYVSAVKIANLLNFKVCYFPPGDWGKDYCDWRDSGKTAEDFMREVLKMPDDVIWALDEKQVPTLLDILVNISVGMGDVAVKKLSILILAHEGYHHILARIKRALMMAIDLESFKLDRDYADSLTIEQWNTISDQIEEAQSAEELKEIFQSWSDVAALRLGVF